MRRLILALSALLVLLLAGCNRGEVVDVQRGADGGADVTYKLTQTEINDAITDALSTAPNPLLRNPSVDLQPAKIVISGEHERRDGKGTVSGTLTMTLTVSDGTLLAQITQADVEGWDATDERIAAFNQRLADNFSKRANRDNKQITYKSVNITDDDVELVFNIKRA